MDMDVEELKKKYQEFETEELIRIAYVDTEDYQPEAVEIAKSEIKKRGISSDELQILIAKISEKLQKDAKLVIEKPLTVGWKIFCLIFPIIALLIIILIPENWIQRRKDAWRWLLYGFFLRIGIILFLEGLL